MDITINGPNGHSVTLPMSDDEYKQLRWTLIKGADCEMDFCSDLLEGLA